MSATNVQDAVTELFTSVSDGKTLVAAAITDKGVATAATDSFQQMASNIGQISSGIDIDAKSEFIKFLKNNGVKLEIPYGVTMISNDANNFILPYCGMYGVYFESLSGIEESFLAWVHKTIPYGYNSFIQYYPLYGNGFFEVLSNGIYSFRYTVNDDLSGYDAINMYFMPESAPYFY